MSGRVLTAAQRAMLGSVRDTGDPFAHLRAISHFGGATGTLASLEARGLVRYVEAGEETRDGRYTLVHSAVGLLG